MMNVFGFFLNYPMPADWCHILHRKKAFVPYPVSKKTLYCVLAKARNSKPSKCPLRLAVLYVIRRVAWVWHDYSQCRHRCTRRSQIMRIICLETKSPFWSSLQFPVLNVNALLFSSSDIFITEMAMGAGNRTRRRVRLKAFHSSRNEEV